MTPALRRALVFPFILSLGLMAGFFFAWSFSGANGLARVPAAVYVEAMQAINEAVRNAWFGAAFFGAIPLGALAVAAGGRAARPWLAAALALYLGAFAVTALGNVPMNREMALWDPAAPPVDVAAFLARWTWLNHLRLGLSLAGFALALPALWRQEAGR
ncbi:anthrone oxygenase family protein [Rhodovulum sp. DZ06]|uniref:anthrone oxygenase family protein n=1 Tax=Rhodovulum sp. DZ06 TaxID=3425126 RepID=UPI003D341BD3